MIAFVGQRRFPFILVVALLALLLYGCDRSATSHPPANTAAPASPTTTANVPAAFPTIIPQPELHALPQIDSSTARIPITQAIYELFSSTYGYTGPKPLTSKTHGAWLNLADEKADIVFLVAPTSEELAYFAQKDIDIEMKIYGYDGLVFIGNGVNPVQDLTSKQIRSIYSGKTTNWSDLGGENADILVYIRNAESGSQRLFESLVWEGYDMPDFSAMDFQEGEIDPTVSQRTHVLQTGDMGEAVRSVLINQYSIGFNIMSYIDSAFSNAALKLFSIDGYAPTTENFASGKYPFLTTSYVAIRADSPQDSPARQLYDWIGSEESRALITANSTLTVAFSDSVRICINHDSPAGNASLADIIQSLDKTYIQRQSLMQFTLPEIEHLRNGIYALSGKIFKTKAYAAYFSAQSWYKGNSQSDEVITKRFNEYQKKNLNCILAYEADLNRALANQ